MHYPYLQFGSQSEIKAAAIFFLFILVTIPSYVSSMNHRDYFWEPVRKQNIYDYYISPQNKFYF